MSGGLTGRVGRVPIPRQQLVEPLDGILGDARENVGEPSLRIDIVHLGRDDQAVHGGAVRRHDRSRRTTRIFSPGPSPVHSAHVGQELEVHYQWHPYFGSKVAVRRVEQRASGQFLKVLGPAGVVVSMAGWMLDPVICVGMTLGGAACRSGRTRGVGAAVDRCDQARTLPERYFDRSGGKRCSLPKRRQWSRLGR